MKYHKNECTLQKQQTLTFVYFIFFQLCNVRVDNSEIWRDDSDKVIYILE